MRKIKSDTALLQLHLWHQGGLLNPAPARALRRDRLAGQKPVPVQLWGPTRKGKIVEASGGNTPMEISGCAKARLFRRGDHEITERCEPPHRRPMAGPLTTQITGLATSSIPANAA